MKKLLLLFLLTFCTLFSWAAGQNSFTDDSNNRKVFQKPIENGSKLTIRGDVNDDGIVNVNDITAVAKIILGTGEGVVDICPDNQHPHMIDLGLPSGTMWCCCNVDATIPEGYGDYYAWGETSVKYVCSNDNYKFWQDQDGDGNIDDGEFTNIGSNIVGTQYDVAYVHMDAPWRMPSKVQFEELLINCTQEWTQQNGVNGIMLTGPNGNRIFFPAAGYRLDDKNNREGLYGYYWSGSLANDDSAYCLNFDSYLCGMNSESRSVGQYVRAVCGKYSSGVKVTLDTIEVTTNNATLEIALEGELEKIDEVRVYYTENSINEPNIENCKCKSIDYSKQGITNDTIKCVLDNLQDKTTYYSFIYVKTENDSICSNVISFTTDAISGVKVTLSDPVEVTTNSATLEIALKGELEKIDSVRVYYTKDKITEPNIELDQYKSFEYSPTPEATNDTIKCILDSLQDNTTYYSFVSVKTKDNIYYYSNVSSFTTDVRVISGVEIALLAPAEIKKDSVTVKFALEGELEKIDSVRVYFAEDLITETNIDSCKYKNIIYTYQGTTKDTINCILDSLQNITTYYYSVHVITDGSTYCSDVASFKTLSKYKTPKDAEAIDLGLSVKWAPYNMGADKIEDYGGLYGWGDPTGELKFSGQSGYGPQVLEPSTNIANTEYDIAHVQWGSHWRLPTEKEIKELFDSCEHKYFKNYNNSGVSGFVFKRNNYEIFIPLAGYRDGYNTIYRDELIWLWTCDINSNGVPVLISVDHNECVSHSGNRCFGNSIRPVYDDNPDPVDPIDPVDPVDPELDDSLYTHAVDLGLSVLWADMNVGADDSNPYGDFYRWGETDTINTTSYNPQDYKYCEGKAGEYEWKYTYLGPSISGNPDYDAATANWGKRWRMPTKKEIKEMIDNCDITPDLQNGISGYKVVSRINDNSIFLPAAGCKYGNEIYGDLANIASYWSGTSDDTQNELREFCYVLQLSGSAVLHRDYRYYGRLIRPVRDKK